MTRIDLAPLTHWITAAAVKHGPELPQQLMARLSISRRQAGLTLRKLAAMQWLTSSGTPRKPNYRPGPLRQVVQRYELACLQEDLPWRRDFAPFFDLDSELRRMAQHTFTELLNNAVDHSGGSTVTVSMRQTPLQIQLLVSDDGCGLFRRIEQSHRIDDPQLALLDLSKGKLTSDPARHRGHGLFFTARLADVLDIHANQAAFQRRAWDSGKPWHAGRPSARGGTSIYMAISLDTTRTLDGVLRAHSLDAAGYAFEQTAVPLQLIGLGQPDAGAALASRADARRVVSGLLQFRRAELDFSGVTDIGHGFADELFRVFGQAHPALELVPRGMSERVAEMVASVTT